MSCKSALKEGREEKTELISSFSSPLRRYPLHTTLPLSSSSLLQSARISSNHPPDTTIANFGPDRHKAMLSYLHSMGLHETYDSLRRETDNPDFDPNDAKAKWVGLLEKKWTSVIRLQKKVGLYVQSSPLGRMAK